MAREAPGSIHIRPATPFDAGILAALYSSCFDTEGQQHKQRAWDAAAMSQFVSGPSTLCLIATDGTEEPLPVGFVLARGTVDEAELLAIGVLDEHRRRGVGKALLQQAATNLAAAGITKLFLEVDETNAAALGLYQNHGAESVGRRPGYYENGGDAAILRLDLQPCPTVPATR